MFRSVGQYTVLEFGYEKVIPKLIQSGYSEDTGIIETFVKEKGADKVRNCYLLVIFAAVQNRRHHGPHHTAE